MTTHSDPIIFMGTPEFAVPCLCQLHRAGMNIALVITQPDRPRGRGLECRAPAVKTCAEQLGLEVLQTASLNSELRPKLAELNPALIVVVACAFKVPPWLLKIPLYGCVNLHPSLLPKYRGAAPLQWALINGDTQTGLTVFYLNEHWDAGDIVYQEPMEIFPGEMYCDLAHRACEQGAGLLARAVQDILAETAPRVPQDDSQASFAPLLTPDVGKLDFTHPAPTLVNLIRGVTPRPGAYTTLHDKRVKFLRAEAVDRVTDAPPGKVVWVDRTGFEIACGHGRLRPLLIQIEGKKPLSGQDFLNGQHLDTNTVFGKQEQPL